MFIRPNCMMSHCLSRLSPFELRIQIPVVVRSWNYFAKGQVEPCNSVWRVKWTKSSGVKTKSPPTIYYFKNIIVHIYFHCFLLLLQIMKTHIRIQLSVCPSNVRLYWITVYLKCFFCLKKIILLCLKNNLSIYLEDQVSIIIIIQLWFLKIFYFFILFL